MLRNANLPKRVKYLGSTVGSEKHFPDPQRVLAIEAMQPPRTKSELRCVLGVLNYRNYMKDYPRVVLPLTELTKGRRNGPISRNDEHEQAFRAAKKALATLAILYEPYLSKHSTLSMDASQEAIGACLAQHFEGKAYPVAFFSKKLSESHVKWSAIEKEAFAVVWASDRASTRVLGA